MKHYAQPHLHEFGSVAGTTKASFTNNAEDNIFLNGQQVGHAIGSMDACVSTNPQIPTGTCNVQNP